MATLEVHHGRGLVERVIIAHDQPVMFGSSPKCDVILSGDGVLPFHGRIRWQEGRSRFMVDASPEAEYLLVNGHKMASAGFHQGDEVRILDNRIFMINETSGPVPAVRPSARDDVTRVQAPAFMPPPAAGQPIKRGSWRERLEAPLPSSETSVIDTQPQAKSAGRGARKPELEAAVVPPPRGWARLIFLFTARANAPGQERVLSSPLVFGLGVTLAALVLVGFTLHGIIARTVSNRLFDTALGNLEDGDYRNAMKRFDEFIAAEPERPARRQGAGSSGDGQRAAVYGVGGRVVVAGARGRTGDARFGGPGGVVS